jgi:hypothetical protein
MNPTSFKSEKMNNPMKIAKPAIDTATDPRVNRQVTKKKTLSLAAVIEYSGQTHPAS